MWSICILLAVNSVISAVIYYYTLTFPLQDSVMLKVNIMMVSPIMLTLMQSVLLQSHIGRRVKRTIKNSVIKLVLWAVAQEIKLGDQNIRDSVIDQKRKIITIHYHYQQQWYSVVLPYNRNRRIAMSSCTVNLMDNEDRLVADLTQQGGVGYLASAEELGGSYIEVHDSSTGTKVRYDSNEVPLFLHKAR